MSKKKQKTVTQTAMIRLLFFLAGKCEKNPNVTSLSIDIKKADYFALAFAYSEDFSSKYYQLSLDQIKNSPQKLVHLLPIKETGFYELVGNLNCTLIYNDNDEIVDSLWKIKDTKMYQLTDEEVDKLNQNL